METELTLQRLYSILKYDPETGIFTNVGCREWRGRRAVEGTQAGYLHNTGRWALKIDGRRYMAHRLAWLYVHKEWPKQYIDHIDGNPLNNRISNLRDVSHADNLKNRYGRGVKKDKYGWTAHITSDGIREYLGYFLTEEQAKEAYLTAKQDKHAEWIKGREYG